MTSSAKTPNQAETIQISTWAATPIWTGNPLALTCTLFDKWLPGCYKGNINKVRDACFCIPCSSEQQRSHYTNTALAVQELTCSIPAPSHLSLLRLSDRESKQSLHTRILVPNGALYTIALVSIGQVKFNRRKPSARTNTKADTIFYMPGEVM